ncbi:MAG: hypothetical protein AB7L09_03140 [Nitrospira sp.]
MRQPSLPLALRELAEQINGLIIDHKVTSLSVTVVRRGDAPGIPYATINVDVAMLPTRVDACSMHPVPIDPGKVEATIANAIDREIAAKRRQIDYSKRQIEESERRVVEARQKIVETRIVETRQKIEQIMLLNPPLLDRIIREVDAD